MKVALVNPAFPASLWDFSGCRDLSGSAFPFLPLALPTLAALTPREHEVALYDENARPAPAELDADVVGITGYHVQKARVFALADRYRREGRAVVIGGPLVSPATIAECQAHADAVFQGEAEYTWPRYLRELAAGAPQRRYVQEGFVALADSPAPRFELLDLGAYASAVVETSRGCPHDCEFCEIPSKLGRVPRVKSVAQVMAEVRGLVRLGAGSIFIIDDNFIGNRRRAREVLGELARFVQGEGRGTFFSCQVTVDAAKDEGLLELLRAANVRRVFTGIETPRRESLEAMGKTQNTRVDLLEAVRKIQSYGIVVWAGFIVGLDGDDAGVFADQRRFIQEAGIPVAMVGLLQAIPGTPLYARVQREGRLLSDEVSGIGGGKGDLYVSNIVPLRLGREELVAGYRGLVRELYRPKAFAERLLRAVRRGAGAPVAGRRASAKERAALGRLLRYYLLTLDPGRLGLFLRAILGTLRAAPGALAAVLMHLVAFKHLGFFYAREEA